MANAPTARIDSSLSYHTALSERSGFSDGGDVGGARSTITSDRFTGGGDDGYVDSGGFAGCGDGEGGGDESSTPQQYLQCLLAGAGHWLPLSPVVPITDASIASHTTPFSLTERTGSGSVFVSRIPVNEKFRSPPPAGIIPAPNALTTRAGCPPGPPGDMSTAVSPLRADIHPPSSPLAIVSPGSNAHDNCQLDNVPPSVSSPGARRFTSDSDASKLTEASRIRITSARYSTSSSHLAGQSLPHQLSPSEKHPESDWLFWVPLVLLVTPWPATSPLTTPTASATTTMHKTRAMQRQTRAQSCVGAPRDREKSL